MLSTRGSLPFIRRAMLLTETMTSVTRVRLERLQRLVFEVSNDLFSE